MADRYYSEKQIEGETAQIAGTEAHHLLHVMRCKVGQNVLLIDNSGYEFEAEIAQLSRQTVDLKVLAKHQVDREFPCELTLATALPKGDRQKWLVEKAVELGISHLIPLTTSRSVSQPVEKAIVRLRRVAIEATKQCGRTRVMEILPAQKWESLLEESQPEVIHLLAHLQSGEPYRLPKQLNKTTKSVLLAIGPEGGFSDEEVASAEQAQWQIVNLGPRILRVETAMTLLTAAVMLRLTEQS